MPASEECFDLFKEITKALQNCGLANSHHDISLSRGASWVRSKCGRGGSALGQQTLHFDYDTTAVGFDRLQLPMSLFVYFQATNLHIIDTEQNFDAGDILLLLGDCPHAGSRWTSTKTNFRLFCFLPTKSCLPLWESGYRHQDTGVWTFYPDSVIVNREDLRDITNPLSADFDLATYNAHAFCSHTGQYCAFKARSWYMGLQTICYNGRNSYRSDAPQPFSTDHGVCLHWPSRSALNKAGLTDMNRDCGQTFLDLRISDCPHPSSKCQKLPDKRSRSPSSASVSSSSMQPSPKVHMRVHTHTHTHTHVAADGTVTETVCKQEIVMTGSSTSSSSFSKSQAQP
jgi:hypothetical protein